MHPANLYSHQALKEQAVLAHTLTDFKDAAEAIRKKFHDEQVDPNFGAGLDEAKVKEMRVELATTHIPFYLGHFEKMLEDSEYLAGDKPTIADAQFLSTVRWLASGNLDHIPATCVDAFPKVKAFKVRRERTSP